VDSIGLQINGFMDNLYQKLNKKLDTLTKQTQPTHNNENNTHSFHSRIVNLTPSMNWLIHHESHYMPPDLVSLCTAHDTYAILG
jgi:hypothetical protein